MNDIVYEEQKQLIKMWKDKYDKKKEEIERLHSIIKEARDFINGKDLKENEYRFVEDFDFSKLLEILDKVEEK